MLKKVKKLSKNYKKHEDKVTKYNYLSTNYEGIEFPSAWSELRASHQFCDGIIKCAGRSYFPIHRPILSAVSPFFRALFINRLNRNAEGTNEVSINNVPGDIFSLILDYAYTGTCKVTAENVEQLLPFADQFQVQGVVQLCCQFLLQELKPDNCLGIYKFAKHYFCKDSNEKCKKYIYHHFKEIYKENSEFKELDHNELISILENDELNVRNEETVFEAIKSWVEVNEKERKEYLPMLLKCIRYKFINSDYISNNILSWKLIQNNQNCQEIFEPSNIKSDLFSRLRIPYEILFAIGGWSEGSPTNFIETYDCRANKWFLSIHTDTVLRAYHGLCTLNNLIYVIGGFDGYNYFNTVRCFNPITKEWIEKACMYHVRCFVSVCTDDGIIYALGGCSNGPTRLSSAERYKPERNQWEMIPPMHRQRSDASAAALNHKIYIVGGFNGKEILRSCEVFDIESNQWSYIRSLSYPRTKMSLVAFGDDLYVFGGYDGLTRLTSVERYNSTERKEWEKVPRMSTARSNLAAVVLDEMIYVFGGYTGSVTTSSMEYYNPKTNQWSNSSSMNLNRCALGACVLSGLPDAKEYSFLSKTKNYIQDQKISKPKEESEESIKESPTYPTKTID
ncbi:kelch-like protein 10 [Chelonus insularis]|uniref:kelch-like protein 10 n=1 Tax=Chelonus insularis TaxID=460826 RepID=UPI00158F0067|nr:kelch-like protein 10 [Chelonus insularis]